jgi:hypothetical protein
VLNAIEPMKPGGNGGMAGIALGGAIDPERDWHVAWQGSWLNNRNTTTSSPTGFNTIVSASNQLSIQTLDGDIGFRVPSAPGLRWFAGASVLNAKNDIDYSDRDSFKLGNFAHRTDLWGAGPRGGLEATVPLESGTFLNFMGAGSVIFAHRSHDVGFSYNNSGAVGAGTPSYDRSVTVHNLEGSAALGYRFSPSGNIQVGYRVQQWWNLAPQVSAATNTGTFNSGESDVLVHGPFAKITVAFP